MDFDIMKQQYGLDELEQGLRQLFPEMGISLEALLERVMAGDIGGAMLKLFRGSIDVIAAQLGSLKNVFIWLVLLGIISTVVSHFTEIFDRHQVADLGFYFMYLLLTTILIKSFFYVAETATATLENITLFVKLLVPAYLLSVGIASGTVTASASCQLMLFVIYGIESILAQGMLPLIYSFFMLILVNGIWVEEKLTLILELIEKGIRFVLKGAIGVVTGLSVFQALITPVVDKARTSVLEKMLKSIPGVGNAAGNVVELALGSAMVIKNSIGIVLLMLMLLLCVAPLVKIGLTAGMLKCAAAMMGVVSDKRMVACANRAGDAGLLLFRTTGTAMLLFLISIAVITAAKG